MKTSAIGTLLVANALLGGGLAYLWASPERFQWAEPAPLRPAFDDLGVAAASTGDVSQFRETISRPLFAANRRPGPVSTAAEGGGAERAALADMRLLGSYGSGASGGAIIVYGGKAQNLRVGEKIGGWTLAGADGRTAILAGAGGAKQKIEMPLLAQAPAAPSSAAAGAPQPAAAQPAAPTRAAAANASRAADRARYDVSNYEANMQIQREVAERVNARRAARGLPPLKVE